MSVGWANLTHLDPTQRLNHCLTSLRFLLAQDQELDHVGQSAFMKLPDQIGADV
jgi:hypothetical protein